MGSAPHTQATTLGGTGWGFGPFCCLRSRLGSPPPTQCPPPQLACCAGRTTETKGGCPRPLQAKRPLSVQEPWPPVVNLALVIHSVLCQQFKRALLVFFADFN